MGTIQIDGSTPKLTIGNATAEDATILFDGNAQDFYIALDDSADDLLIGLGSTVGTTPIIAIDENKLSTFSGAITVGVDDTGHDVKLFGATSGSFALWDESADSLLLTDSTPIKIGDAQDLTLYHDGTNSYITNAVGALKIATETSGIALTIGHTTSEVTIGDNLTTTGTLTVGSTGITNNGITGADHWRLSSSFTDAATPIASNLEQVDTGGFAGIGSAMTQSSGVFAFPTTGIWFIFAQFKQSLNGDSRYHWNSISTTVDNTSNWVELSRTGTFIQQTSSNTTISSSSCCAVFDVTNTTNCKVRFTVSVANSSTATDGDSGITDTGFMFLRLGDT
jgi:hypothetical protein